MVVNNLKMDSVGTKVKMFAWGEVAQGVTAHLGISWAQLCARGMGKTFI